jgi:hypothetical protein
MANHVDRGTPSSRGIDEEVGRASRPVPAKDSIRAKLDPSVVGVYGEIDWAEGTKLLLCALCPQIRTSTLDPAN